MSEQLHEKISEELFEAMNTIFLEHQKDLDIQDGYIDPAMYENLDIAKEDLARVMTGILLYQKYKVYER